MISAFVIVVNEAVFPDFADIIEVGLSGCGGHWTLTMGKPVPRVKFFLSKPLDDDFLVLLVTIVEPRSMDKSK
jgi:hypothetical protein